MPRYQLGLIRYPTGKYGFVGSLPAMLTEPVTTASGDVVHQSRIVDTYEDAARLLAHARLVTERTVP